MKRKIAAILVADVVGYSRLVAEDENRALEHLLACREIFAEFVERGGGRIFNTAGDAVLAEFPSAVEALLAGIDIQDCLRTRYASDPGGFRMQFRMGLTIGDVVERDGDLLGDGVNVASRLEGLARPGGICISGIMHEQVLNKVSARFRDVGLKTVKNIPSPIHVFALDGGETSSDPVPSARRRFGQLLARLHLTDPRLSAVAAVLAVVVVAGSVLALRSGPRDAPRPTGVSPTARSEASATAPSPGIYGVVRPARPIDAPSPAHPFDAAATPFVSDGERLVIGKVLSTHGPNSALALSTTGSYGVVADRPSPDEAREGALKLCSEARRGPCSVYAVNGVVTWPRPIPLPSKPWIDPTVARRPFDAGRLRGLSVGEVKRAADLYTKAGDAKALVMGPVGSWWYRSRLGDEDEAMRVDLEQCGDQAGIACRVVAVDDQFVVPDTDGPVEPGLDPIGRCDRLAGAPFDAGPAGNGISFADIDANIAIPACRDALHLRPSDPSLQLSLGRAIDKSGLLPEKALELYRSSAAAGDAAAMNVLGMAYDSGRLGLMQDAATAVDLYRRAADGGDPAGMRNLGTMFSSARGVGWDKEQASRLFARADQAEAAWRPKQR